MEVIDENRPDIDVLLKKCRENPDEFHKLYINDTFEINEDDEKLKDICTKIQKIFERHSI